MSVLISNVSFIIHGTLMPNFPSPKPFIKWHLGYIAEYGIGIPRKVLM